jgi:hypothetical protein
VLFAGYMFDKITKQHFLIPATCITQAVRRHLQFNNTLHFYCLCLFKRLAVAVFFRRTAFRDFVHFQKFVTALSIVVNIKIN